MNASQMFGPHKYLCKSLDTHEEKRLFTSALHPYAELKLIASIVKELQELKECKHCSGDLLAGYNMA